MSTATTPPATEVAYPSVQLFIAGQWRDGGERKTLAVHNPATGKEIGRVAHAGQGRPGPCAASAAQKGFEAWRDVPASSAARSCARPPADARARRRHRALLTQEQGKPLAEAKGEAIAAADIIEWFAEEGLRVYGRIVPLAPTWRCARWCSRTRSGPVAAFTPWNFPINQVVRKLGAGAGHRLLDARQGAGGNPGRAGRADPRLRRRRPAGRRARPGVRQPGRDLAAT